MTYFTEEQVALLLKPIHPRRVLMRDGMSYVEGYDIRAELNRVFGFGRWSEEILDQALVCETNVKTKGGRDAWYVVYRTRKRLTIHAPDGTEVTHYDGSHVGESTHPVRGEAHGNALTNSETYALRRCAINLGDQFGLSLYNKGSMDALVRWTLVRPAAGEKTDGAATDTDDVPQVAQEQPESAADDVVTEAASQDNDAPDLGDWQVKIDAITSAEDAEAAEAELYEAFGSGSLDETTGNVIRDAIRAKGARLTAAPGDTPAVADGDDAEWVRAFRERLTGTGDAAGIRERRAEIIKAAAAKKIGPATANDLIGTVNHRKGEMGRAAA